MGTDAAIQAELREIIDAALRGEVSEERAARVYELGLDAVCALVVSVNLRTFEKKISTGS